MLKNAGGALTLVGLLAMAVLLDLQDVTTLLLLGRQIIASFLGLRGGLLAADKMWPEPV